MPPLCRRYSSRGAFPVLLKNADVLLKPTGNKSNFFEGNLGIDLLQQARKTTFDFGANDAHASIAVSMFLGDYSSF
jgi:hypothetical protein